MKTRKLLNVMLALLLVVAAVKDLAADAQRFDFPAVGQYQVLRGDFHMHTIHSDGSLSGKAFDLGPYQEVTVDAGAVPVTIRWENVWTGLKDNLRMTYGAPAQRAS